MRYSREHKLETHARIVRKASVRLREKGAHGIGVADLMKEAGLTHGGFYAHFDSREALVIEAFADAMDRSTERWRKLGEATTPDRRFATIVDSYLTALHRDNPGHGCAIPTLGAEIARESPRTRKAFAAKLEQMIEVLAAQLPDVPRKAARKQATAAIATMMGTMVMARVAGNGDFSEEILQAGRDAVLGSGPQHRAAQGCGTGAALTGSRINLARPFFRPCIHKSGSVMLRRLRLLCRSVPMATQYVAMGQGIISSSPGPPKRSWRIRRPPRRSCQMRREAGRQPAIVGCRSRGKRSGSGCRARSARSSSTPLDVVAAIPGACSWPVRIWRGQ